MVKENIPKEQEQLFDMLIGMAVTLEEIRETLYTIDKRILVIEDKLNSSSIEDEKKDRTNFENRVNTWLRRTKK